MYCTITLKSEGKVLELLKFCLKFCNKVKVKLIKGAYWISSIFLFIQYCDSNIGLFSIGPPLVIALPTLRLQSCRS